MKRFEHFNVKSFDEASSKLTANSMVIAGGTDLVGTLKKGILPNDPERIVNLKEIPEAAYINKENDTVKIGAMTALSDVAKAGAEGAMKAVAEAAYSVATPLIRNAATIGGNICQDVRCWYYRYPDSIGGKLLCARKGGDMCYAVQGRNQNHSIFGGMKAGMTPCSAECPAGTDIPGYMSLLRSGDIDGAAKIYLQYNPLPMLTSRVCPHTCQTKCNQCANGESVSIHAVERALGDYILANTDKYYPTPAKETGKKVSIVGAGPAGLTAAYYLRKEGHNVVIYDKMPEAGGVLMYGIPEYRLPKHYVRDVVKAIADMGVEFVYNTEVGKDISLDEIKANTDTVFLDTGAWKQPILGLDGEGLAQFGLNFLVEVKGFMNRQIGKDVLVCGGGNVAMDVALTAKRLGAENVTLVCLEQREEMPASVEEIARAEEEGVVIINGRGLSKVIYEGKEVKGLVTNKCVAVRDENGRFNPQYDNTDLVEYSSDCIILATGQSVDLDFLGDAYKEQLKSARGLIEIGEHKDTREPGVYAGGDAASGPSVAIKAIRDGAIAARSISKYMGYEMDKRVTVEGLLKHDSELAQNKVAAVEKDTPIEMRKLDVEDSASLTMEEAVKEAGRCMNCGCYSVNASDISPVLVTAGATIKTTKREIPASVFFSAMHSIDLLETGEIVTEIAVPELADYRCGYYKFRVREAIDFAITSLAYAIKEEDGTIVDAKLTAGGVAPIPYPLTKIEAFLKGKAKSEEVAEAAAALIDEEATPMSENAYKVQEIKVQIKKAILG